MEGVSRGTEKRDKMVEERDEGNGGNKVRENEIGLNVRKEQNHRNMYESRECHCSKSNSNLVNCINSLNCHSQNRHDFGSDLYLTRQNGKSLLCCSIR